MRIALAPLTAVTLLLAACGGGGSSTPEVTEPPKTPEDTAERFLTLWKERKYGEMYDLVSTDVRATIDRQKFIERYEAITDEATISDLDFELKPAATTETVEIPFSVTIHTGFFGDIEEDNALPLVKEAIEQPAPSGETPRTREEWRVQWAPSLIFAELDDTALVHFFTRVPHRGGIYDRNGKELAVDASLPVVGIVPDLLTDREAVIARLT